MKIIDDDFFQSIGSIEKVSIKNGFKEIIAQTRPDRINASSISTAKVFGVSHLIFGVETLTLNFLKSAEKTSSNEWESLAFKAIEICLTYGIGPRPILMIAAPLTDLSYLKYLKNTIKDWKVSNGIEVLFSFFTPHPGLKLPIDKKRFITNDLRKFDHVNLVYLPKSYRKNDRYKILENYHEMVETTESHRFNPNIDVHENFGGPYKAVQV